MSDRLNILVIESSAIVRAGVVGLLRTFSGLSFDLSEVDSLQKMDIYLLKHTPDILIINPNLMDGLKLKDIREKFRKDKNSKFIAIQSELLKKEKLRDFDAVFSINDEAIAIREKLENIIKQASIQETTGVLTSREKEIITELVKGKSNKEIASSLNLSLHTVQTHRRNISAKLQIHSAAGLLIYAIANKIVDLDD